MFSYFDSLIRNIIWEILQKVYNKNNVIIRLFSQTGVSFNIYIGAVRREFP